MYYVCKGGLGTECYVEGKTELAKEMEENVEQKRGKYCSLHVAAARPWLSARWMRPWISIPAHLCIPGGSSPLAALVPCALPDIERYDHALQQRCPWRCRCRRPPLRTTTMTTVLMANTSKTSL
jgi:hypothetical protein